MEPKRNHIVCIPAPSQGHINPMFKLANLLHSKGFYITFIHTEFNYRRLLYSSSSDITPPSNLDNFNFETIPDGLPAENKRGVDDLAALCSSLTDLEAKKALRSILMKLGPIICMIIDPHVPLPYELSKELDIRVLSFYTPSASAVLGYLHFDEFVERGIFPLKDESYLTDGFLDTPVDWLPGLKKGAKLKHLSTFIRTTDPNHYMFNYNIECANCAIGSRSLILNTFDDLEHDVVEAIKAKIPNVYTIGPVSMLCQQAGLHNFGSNMWKEDASCLEWLDKRGPKSVIYVNYGSLTTLTLVQLQEFAWGLANSKQYFLWVIRDDMVSDTSLYEEYMEDVKERAVITSWCDQEKVLKHPSIGAFLTHCGWNSIMESIGEGIPMICWPFFADQQMNCFYACKAWGVGVEIGEGDVTKESIEEVVREVMDGDKGKEMREKAMDWKRKAKEATTRGGSSLKSFENLVKWLMEKNNHCC